MSDIQKQLANLSPEQLALLSQRLRTQKATVTQTSIPRQSRETNVFHTSLAQQRLWFLDQLDPGTPFYNICRAFWLNGRLDVEALERSLNTIVQRHEVLRTTFQAVDAQPMQVIAPFAPVLLHPVQVEHASEDELRQLVREEARTPFDLSRGPLLRATLLRFHAEAHIFILTLHHIVFDGWSMEIFFRELSALYAAYSTGRQSSLPALPIQYVDYAVWQREWLQGARLEAQQAYWLHQLRNIPEILALPTDRPRPALQTFQGAMYSFTLSPHASTQLQEISKREGVTLFMTLLAVFQVLLCRYTGQGDLVLGSPIANRTRTEIEKLIGFFVNTLVLRTKLSAESSFRELLQHVHEVTVAAYAHQDLPFEQLVELLQPTRNLSYSPLYQVLFDLQTASHSGLQLSNIAARPIDFERGVAKCDLTLFMVHAEKDVQGTFEYNTDLFERATIQRMATHFQALAEHIVAHPDRRIADLPLLTEAERRQLLFAWNATQTQYPREQCIHQIFEAQVARTPDALALVFGEEQVTYRELNQQANRLARYLQQHGVGPDVPVGVCMERSVDMIVGLLGILKAGGAYVPFDPTYPKARLAYLLQDAQVSVLLTQSYLLPVLSSYQLTTICLDSERGMLAHQDSANVQLLTTSAHLAYITYTSGSTGQPKGVSITHQNVIRLVQNTNYIVFSQEDAFLQFAPISFDASTFEIWGSLLNGARLVIFPAHLPSLEELADCLHRYQISTLWLTAGLFHQMVEYHIQALAQVRYMLAGGDVLSASHTRRLVEVFAGKGTLINGYGPTENTTFTCCYAMTTPEQVGWSVSIGKPIANTTVYLLDAFLQPVPVGVPGEMYIGGEGLARGYFKRPDLTAERFIPHPYSTEPGARLYKTGDLARFMPNGNIEFLGRIDSQVKLRGFRIELGEIEDILNQHPGVQETIALLRKDAAGEKRLVGYVILRAGQSVTTHALYTFLQERLPEYMLPAQIIVLDTLPLTPNGKVDRNALPSPGWERSSLTEATAFVAPRNAIEKAIVQIWSEILGVESVGIHDNFFNLGGHSLRATKAVSRIRTVLHVDIPLRDLFEAPTVAGLAVRIHVALNSTQVSKMPPFQSVSRDILHPLSFTQERLWFMDQLEAHSSTYNISYAIRLTGSLDTDSLAASLQTIINRHEVFRTTFVVKGTMPVQVIASRLDLPLLTTDLRGYPELVREQEAQQVIRGEAQQPFDLQQGPLLRAHLVRLALDEHVLLLTTHHIVADGWSMNVVLRELAQLYEAFMHAQPSPLPPLPLQYVDYAVWQRAWLQGEVMETQLAYWKQYLAGAPMALERLTSYPGCSRPVVPSYRGAWHFFSFSKDLIAGMKRVCAQEDATLFMLLLAAFETLLCRYTGQDDFLVGTPIASRTYAEIEGLVGFFTNMLVLRAKLVGNPRFCELLRQTREATLGAYAHQDLPFAKLVEALQPRRDPSRNPLFQVMFIFNNEGLRQTPQFSDLTMSFLQVDNGTEKFDVTLSIIESEDSLQGALEYSTDLFDARSIEQMASHFQTLLAHVVADPEQRIANLPLLSEAERTHLLSQSQQLSKAAIPTRCMHALFEEQVTRTPDNVALIVQDDRLTYRELNKQTNQVAHDLRKRGIGPEIVVGICMQPCSELVVGILAILKAGGVVLALDPSSEPGQLVSVLSDLAFPLLLTQPHILNKLPQSRSEVVLLDRVQMQLGSEYADDQPNLTMPENSASLRFTSGSTDQPKGVWLSHQALVHESTILAQSYGLRADDRVYLSTSVAGLIETIFPILLNGATAVLPRQEESALADMLARIARQHVTMLLLTTATWNQWVRELSQAHPSVPLSLRLVAVYGEKVTSTHFQTWHAWAGETVQWYTMYHLTEATTSVLFQSSQAAIDEKLPTMPVGQPRGATQIFLMDASGQLVPMGVPGEVYIGGPSLARGYVHDPALTAERFVPNPFGEEPGARLYKTGDMARYLPDGNLEFLGRLTSHVAIGGFHVSLDMIELVCLELPEIQDVVIVPWEKSRGQQVLIAYITVSPSHSLNLSTLRSRLRARLPEYMLPAHLCILETIPRTVQGKVWYRALPPLKIDNNEISGMSSAPQSALERSLVQIWQEVLQRENVGLYDNFFDLGGHSLLLLQVHEKLSTHLKQALPLVELFNYPTVSALAEYIASQQQHKKETDLVGQNRASARKEAMERHKKAKLRH